MTTIAEPAVVSDVFFGAVPATADLVAEQLRQNATERDRANATPRAEFCLYR